MILKRIGILSLVKMSGIVHACAGLIFGAIYNLVAGVVGGVELELVQK